MLDDPELFSRELNEFIETTEPFQFDIDWMRERLRQGPTHSG